jgi:2-phospho-L-lactate guanylyltransferase
MDTVVPFATERPNSRLAPVLGPDDRRAFARAMLRDLLSALRAAGREPRVLATAPLEVDAPVTVDDRELDPAINDVLAGADEPVAVVMADLALATADALEGLFAATGDVVLAPGRGGGTNAIVAYHPDVRVDYHGASIRDHRRIARGLGADLVEVDSFRLATDVDEPTDLAEVLLHGEGGARDWLVDAGVERAGTEGRVGVDRGG